MREIEQRVEILEQQVWNLIKALNSMSKVELSLSARLRKLENERTK